VPIVIVDPKSTSSTCPRCGDRLLYIHRLAVCKKCDFKADRDSVGAMNIWLRALQAYAGAPGSPPRAPAVKGEARRSGGTIDEGVKKAVRAVHN
jgi:putative transposase